MSRELHLSLRREGDRIYFLINLTKYGYWTVSDLAAMRGFGESFWSGDFTGLALPALRPCDPECVMCGARDAPLALAAGIDELFCAVCWEKVVEREGK